MYWGINFSTEESIFVLRNQFPYWKINLQLRTEKSSPVYEVAHAFHVFNKKYLFQTNSYWSNIKNDPYLYVISDIEALDVDNEEDFIISEAVYKQFPYYCWL